MEIDRSKLYDDAAEFFYPSGNVIMQLTPRAAVEVCLGAANRGVWVSCVEGGFHKEGSFGPDGWCIWDGSKTPGDFESRVENNKRAAQFVRDNSDEHTAFLITVGTR